MQNKSLLIVEITICKHMNIKNHNYMYFLNICIARQFYILMPCFVGSILLSAA